MSTTLDISKAYVAHEWKHDRPLVSCRFDPLGRYVFCGGEEANVSRFALVDGSKTTFTGGHDTWVNAFGFSADGRTVVSGGSDGRLVWWEAAASEPKPQRVVEAHRGWIRSMATSPDGQQFISGGNDHVVRLWNIADGALVREFVGHERHVYCVDYHPQGKFLLTGDLLGRLIQWEVATGQIVREFTAKELHSYNGGQQVDFGGIRAIGVSPDGSTLAAGGLYKATNPLGAVHEPLVQRFTWDSQEALPNQIAEGITQGVIWRMKYLSDGTLMAVSGGGSGGFLLFWKADSDKDINRFKLPNLARDLDLHPDGLQVATAHHDHQLRITRLCERPAG